MSENNSLMKNEGKHTVYCPTCGKVYELWEFEKLEPIRNIDVDIVETRKCDECGEEFGYMYRPWIKDSDKKSSISVCMDLYLS